MGINIYFLTKNYMPNHANIVAGKIASVKKFQRHYAVVCYTDNHKSFAYINMGPHNTKRAEVDRRSPLMERLLTRLYRGKTPTLLTFNTVANVTPTMLECEFTSVSPLLVY